VLFFNATEGYRVSHPVPGGDDSLSLAVSEPLLRELAPRAFLRDGEALALRRQNCGLMRGLKCSAYKSLVKLESPEEQLPVG